MLFAVCRSYFYAFLICAAFAWGVLARGIPSRSTHRDAPQQEQQNQPQQAAPPQQVRPPQNAEPGVPPPQENAPTQLPAAPPVHLAPLIVVDPGHGGIDTGARGTSGLVEKDVVLQVAKILRSELERLGYRVVMTRGDDSNPSHEDRAAIANAYRDATFVSLHVSSTGAVGTARTYYYEFPNSLPADASGGSAPAPTRAAVTWEELQRPFAEPSRRLANLVQIELTHRFPQSPNAPAPVAVRNLRSVAAPAIAVEISSVSVSDPITLTSLSGPLAASVAKGIAAFRPLNPINPNPSGQP
jgi:N-acetylmuramoyl-L-alanine amidase